MSVPRDATVDYADIAFFAMSPKFWPGLQMDSELATMRASFGDRLEREATLRAA